MKTLTKVVLAIFTLGTLTPIADARGCPNFCRPVYHAPYVAPVIEKVIEKRVIVTEFVPFIAYVPVALATYVPVAAAPAVPLAPVAPVPPGPAAALPAPQAQLPVVPVAPAVPAAVPAATVDPCTARLAPLMARIAALEAKLGAVPNNQPQAAPKDGIAKAVTVAQNRCAKCHEAATAEKDGGNFVMFRDGEMVELTERQANGCFKKIIKGEMPPEKEGKLSQEDGRALVEFFDKYQPKK